ncbi:MAG: hypothetical protein LBH59_09215 [Planctomycetaceae bacterium]|nr:hypothetical protein [Planctomycetaceae bacterium]
MSEVYLSDASLRSQGIFMKPETAKPILDQIAKQINEIWKRHTDKSLLSGTEQNEVILLQNLYTAICTEFIGRTYFYEAENFQRDTSVF